MSAAAPISALVLAAGASTRLGQPKQSVRFNNQPLLLRAVQLAASCVDGEVHVVVGANAAADSVALKNTAVKIHVVTDWEKGQRASLLAGLARIRDGHAALVLVVDQYRLTRADLCTLVDAWRAQPTRPAAACYAQIVGVPVVWPQSMLKTLMAGRCLGRDLLAEVDCTKVPLPAAGFDLDTPDDLTQLRQFEGVRSG